MEADPKVIDHSNHMQPHLHPIPYNYTIYWYPQLIGVPYWECSQWLQRTEYDVDVEYSPAFSSSRFLAASNRCCLIRARRSGWQTQH